METRLAFDIAGRGYIAIPVVNPEADPTRPTEARFAFELQPTRAETSPTKRTASVTTAPRYFAVTLKERDQWIEKLDRCGRMRERSVSRASDGVERSASRQPSTAR